GDSNSQSVSKIVVDSKQKIVVLGDFDGTVNFGGADLIAPIGSSTVFVAKLDANESHVWSKSFGQSALGLALAIEPDDSIALGAGNSGTTDFGSGNRETAGGQAAIVGRYEP